MIFLIFYSYFLFKLFFPFFLVFAWYFGIAFYTFWCIKLLLMLNFILTNKFGREAWPLIISVVFSESLLISKLKALPRSSSQAWKDKAPAREQLSWEQGECPPLHHVHLFPCFLSSISQTSCRCWCPAIAEGSVPGPESAQSRRTNIAQLGRWPGEMARLLKGTRLWTSWA